MAAISGTYTRYSGVQGLREDLTDAVYNISPEDVPFMSGIGRGQRARNTLHEWQTENLDAADGSNAHVDGDETSFSTPTPTVRVGNYTQISKKSVIISGTLEAVDAAGRESELAHQVARKGVELKRDMETIVLQNQGGDAGGSTTARLLAPLPAWLKTNTDFNTADGGDPTYTSGVPSAARTDSATPRAFTETIAKAVLQSMYTNGGRARALLVGAFNKGQVSGFAGIATKNYDLSNVSPRPTAIIGSADVYVGEFDTVRVIPSRFQRARDAFFVDWDMAELNFLRNMFTERLAKTGDAEKRHMIAEYTLKVKQEAGLGAAYDLTSS